MFKIILISLIASLILSSCGSDRNNCSDMPTENIKEASNVFPDYIDEIIFLGESTTYHLKSRGVLKDGANTTQVWAPKSGTLMLEPSISDCRIIYPETREEISLEEAIEKKKPKYMMLTFGLNGAPSFISRGEKYFKSCYQRLLDLIKSKSPNTKIIINSCFPIAKDMDMSRHTITASELNGYIDALNLWAKELAFDNGILYLESASVLKDEAGYLKNNFKEQDGYHLNTKAYKCFLEYLSKNPIS